jgi:hypothetical protein
MNERIEQISKEAWRQVDVSKIRGRHRAYTEIFGQLMVKECAQVVADCEQFGCSRPVKWEVLEHFGVEE